MERLIARVKVSDRDGTISLAVAAHSLRAVKVSDAALLRKWAHEQNMPFHVHIEEQPKEIQDCLASPEAEGKRPLELINDVVMSQEDGRGPSRVRVTAVHCTHSTRETLEQFCAKDGIICVCPATEGFLGDGIPNLASNDSLCLGTDCNNRICMFEEMRWLTFCQNMIKNSRSCAGLSAQKLIEIATKNGARSLGVDEKVGVFETGNFFDFIAIDLSSPRLKLFNDSERLLDSLVFGCGNAEIVASGVAGKIKYVNREFKEKFSM